MICAACEARTDAVPCEACGAEPRVDGRFALEGLLGAGAVGTTWRASGPTGPVAVKELALRRVRTAKSRELIDREIRVLRELSHPAVPRLHEVVETGSGRGKTLWLVLDLVEGAPLSRRWQGPAPESAVLDVLERVARVLGDLHALRPPVIHRDLKPQNLIARPDGRIALVDFGSVRDAVEAPTGGSTVVGTFGYTAPEQLQGDASPASDLYALGATAVHLLAGKPPHRLLDRAGHLRWRDAVHVSVGLGALLDDLLQPDPTRRIADADEVARTARWLRTVRTRSGSQPRPVRSVAPAPTRAPREAEPLVGMLRDAYDGTRSPPPALAARRPTPLDELPRGPAALESRRASLGSVTRHSGLVGVGQVLALAALLVVALLVVAAGVAGGAGALLSEGGSALVPAGGGSTPSRRALDIFDNHPGSFADVVRHCPGGPGRPVAVRLAVDPAGRWSPIPTGEPELDCLGTQVAAGMLGPASPASFRTTAVVPLILDPTGWGAGGVVAARTTDGVFVEIDTGSGAVSKDGRPVVVDLDGHIGP